MLIMTAKLPRRKLAFSVAAAALVCCAALVLNLGGGAFQAASASASGLPSPKGVKSNEDRVAYLEGYGWQVLEEPLATEELLIPEEMDERYLETVSNALTEQMRGKTIQDLPQVVERLRGQVKNGEGVFRSLIESVRHQNQSQKMRSIVFDGTKNLFKHQEYNNLERAQNFLAAMDTRELFYDMLSQAQQMQIHISIGSENEDESLKDSSIVTATYSVGGQQCGSFGVIGPTRMNYARVLAIMNYLTQCMDQMLGDPKDRE